MADTQQTAQSMLANGTTLGEKAGIFSAAFRAFMETWWRGGGIGHEPDIEPTSPKVGAAHLWAKHARLVMEEGIELLILDLEAEVRVKNAHTPFIPEETQQYQLDIHHGRIAMDALSITTLLNRHAYTERQNSPLQHLAVQLTDNEFRLVGRYKPTRMIHLPIDMRFHLSSTPAGGLILGLQSLRVNQVSVARTLQFFGIALESYITSSQTAAIKVQGDCIHIDPIRLMPHPQTQGKLIQATIKDQHLIMEYARSAQRTRAPLIQGQAPCHITLRGHDLLIGKLLMRDVHLQMVPLQEGSEAVEFSLPHYRAQLAEGTSSLKPNDAVLYKLPSITQTLNPI
jgi:hypothetical protein